MKLLTEQEKAAVSGSYGKFSSPSNWIYLDPDFFGKFLGGSSGIVPGYPFPNSPNGELGIVPLPYPLVGIVPAI